MKKGGKFSEERLFRIRRLRRARRYFRQTPLFAYQRMREELPTYTYQEFLDDLRRRTPKRKRKPKSQLVRYGRYERMRKLLLEYQFTKVVDYAIQAKRLRERMTKPYRVAVRMDGKVEEYEFSPLIPIEQIEALVGKLQGRNDRKEIEETIKEFTRWETLK